jgi:2',3'-cyclic-nucleotide 2'-phosphodiesterase (5'-nucleotidase family)
LVSCHIAHSPVKMTANNQEISASADSSYSMTETFLTPYRQQLQDSFSTIIAYNTDKLVKEKPGGSLGNLVTDAMWQFSKYNTPGTSQAPPETFVIMNYGGIRLKEIAAGPISIGKIFELLPFENTLVRMGITGLQLKQLVTQINTSGGWPMKFDTKKFVSLNDINENQRYELVTNNYIAQGGDNCSLLKALPKEDTGILIRDIVIDYVRNQKDSLANKEKRLLE